MDGDRHITRIDWSRAWRQPPAAAAARTLGTTTAIFFGVGGLNVLASSVLSAAQFDTRVTLVVGTVALLTSGVCYGFRASLPRGFYVVVVLLGTLLITACVLASRTPQAALVQALNYTFVVADAAFYFSIRTGLLQYAAMLAGAGFALLRAGVDAGAFAFLMGVCFALLVVILWISRMTDANEEDPLTNLLNRRGIEARLDDAIRAAREDGVPLAVAIIDLDNFKQVNDSQSHLAGDKLLIDCAATWRRQLPAKAWLGRYGGDEFVLVFPGTGIDAAARIVDALREATPVQTTASVGVAAWQAGDSASMLISRADSVLYTAKSLGRNRTVAYGATAL